MSTNVAISTASVIAAAIAAAEEASAAARDSKAASETAAAAAAKACKAASESAAVLATTLKELTTECGSEAPLDDDSSTESDAVGAAHTFPPFGVPVGAFGAVAAADIMQVIAALNPARSVRRRGDGGGGGDRLRVGFALKHNEGLLRSAGRVAEAELMATFYDLFCMRSPETYEGRRATRGEYSALTRTTAITVETLLAMAEEDREVSLAAAANVAEMSAPAQSDLSALDPSTLAPSALAPSTLDPSTLDPSNPSDLRVRSGRVKDFLPEWLEATLEVTGDQSDIVTQSEILGLMRDPVRGWKYAGRHKAKKIKQFLKSWFDSKGVYYGDSLYRIGDERFHQVHCKGLVVKHASSSDDEDGDGDTPTERCTSCDTVDLLNQGLCGACDPASRAERRCKERRVRELFDENGLTYSSHNKAVEGGFRPDFVFDAATHFVVVEVDENQHRAYPADGERSRMVSLCRALGKPTFFVRFNPDAYAPGGCAGSGRSPEEPLAVREKTLVIWVKRLIFSSLRPRGAEALYLFFDGYAPERVRLEQLGGL
jgi:hypothetical protein